MLEEPKKKSGATISLVPGEDYIFDPAQVNNAKGFYRYPEADQAFHRRAPASYEKFRSMWCVQRRLRPMVPCAENTPLPSRRVSKETRAKILSVYLRPWTLAKPMATTAVPFLVDIAVAGKADDAESLCQCMAVRPAWKQYMTAVLPHAERGLRNFMLTTVAEGRAIEDDDEKNHTRGPDVVCELSLQKVHAAIALSSKDSADNSASSRFVVEAAQQAAQISQLDRTELPSDALMTTIVSRQQEVPPLPKPEKEMGTVPDTSTVDVSVERE